MQEGGAKKLEGVKKVFKKGGDVCFQHFLRGVHEGDVSSHRFLRGGRLFPSFSKRGARGGRLFPSFYKRGARGGVLSPSFLRATITDFQRNPGNIWFETTVVPW